WFPAEPKQTFQTSASGDPVRMMVAARGDYGFSVVDAELPSDEQDVSAWRKEAVEGIAQRIQGRVLQSESKEFLGNPGFEATLSHGPRNRLRVVGFSRRGHRYLLTGTAPDADPAVQQFLDSFDLNT